MSLKDQLKKIKGDSDDEDYENINKDHFFTEKGANRRQRISNWVRSVKMNHLVGMN